MPIYKIREKFWFWEADYYIQDEQGNTLFSLQNKWFAMDHAMKLIDEQPQTQLEGDDLVERPIDSPPKKEKEILLTIRKKIVSLGPVFQVIRSDNTVVAEIKKKRIWTQQRYVLDMADVEYVVDESKWRNQKTFSIRYSSKKKETIADVFKKSRLRDMSGSLWVDVKVDPGYYEGQALKDMCATVLAACITMLQILSENEIEELKQQQERELKAKRDKMPFDTLS